MSRRSFRLERKCTRAAWFPCKIKTVIVITIGVQQNRLLHNILLVRLRTRDISLKQPRARRICILTTVCSICALIVCVGAKWSCRASRRALRVAYCRRWQGLSLRSADTCLHSAPSEQIWLTSALFSHWCLGIFILAGGLLVLDLKVSPVGNK